MSFRGSTYAFPISIWVPQEYPQAGPIGFVTPGKDMMVRSGQYVSGEGRIYHPFLANWKNVSASIKIPSRTLVDQHDMTYLENLGISLSLMSTEIYHLRLHCSSARSFRARTSNRRQSTAKTAATAVCTRNQYTSPSTTITPGTRQTDPKCETTSVFSKPAGAAASPKDAAWPNETLKE